MTKFDLCKARDNEKVIMSDGSEVRIVCFDSKIPSYPIIFLKDNDGVEYIGYAEYNGRCMPEIIDGKIVINKLMMAEDIDNIHNIVVTALKVFAPTYEYDDFISNCRVACLADARMAVSAYVKHMYNMHPRIIGNHLNRNRSTIICAIRKHYDSIVYDKTYNEKYKRFIDIIDYEEQVRSKESV